MRAVHTRSFQPFNLLHIWLVAVGGLLLFKFFPTAIISPQPGLNLAEVVNLLKQVFATFFLCGGILLLLAVGWSAWRSALMYQRGLALLRPRARPFRSVPHSRPYPFADSTPGSASPEAVHNAFQPPRNKPFNRQPPRPPEAPGLPLTRYADLLLGKAASLPNFTTTPLPGQRRVLAKLAENFIPAPQRSAALALALFRLRQPKVASQA